MSRLYYHSDDYAGLDLGKNLTFYFGYEVQWCQKHKCITHGSKKCEEWDCQDTEHVEWCFSANIKGKWFYIPASKLEKIAGEPIDNVVDYLLVGIGEIFKRMLKNETR